MPWKCISWIVTFKNSFYFITGGRIYIEYVCLKASNRLESPYSLAKAVELIWGGQKAGGSIYHFLLQPRSYLWTTTEGKGSGFWHTLHFSQCIAGTASSKAKLDIPFPETFVPQMDMLCKWLWADMWVRVKGLKSFC